VIDFSGKYPTHCKIFLLSLVTEHVSLSNYLKCGGTYEADHVVYNKIL